MERKRWIQHSEKTTGRFACVYVSDWYLMEADRLGFGGWNRPVAFLYATPWKERGIRFIALAIGMPVMLMLGALCFERQTAFRDAYLRRLCDGQEIRLAGKLYKVEEKTHCFYYYLTDCSVELSDQTMPCNDVLAYVSSDDDSVGQILILQGTISLFDEATNEGQFDARSFYRSQKIDFGLWVDQVERVAGEPDRLRVWLDKVRMELGIPFARYAKDDGVLSAMLLGDKTELDSEIKSLYQAAGHRTCAGNLGTTYFAAWHDTLPAVQTSVRTDVSVGGKCCCYISGMYT